MFKVEDNKKKTGKYLKKLILDKYKSQKMCIRDSQEGMGQA